MTGPVGRLTAAEGSRGALGTVLAAAGAWLLEPAQPLAEPALSAPAPPRPVIAVFGLAHGCGATVVARGLAAELAARDAHGTAAVHCDARATGIPLATPAASRLARQLAEVPGAETRAVGRLCLVGGAERRALADCARHVAPLVLDAGASSLGGVPASLSDQVVVVAGPSSQPALASVAAECLARVGPEPIVVLNRAGRAGEADGWSTHAGLLLPDSRMGAQLALGGREPRGELGRAVAELADWCEGRR
ncbi:MAG: hypothetical protein QOH58_909 [Thermoleophilaceae bacterium]|nr:hypothetical protein [Thermoleophilaceae bacterium]